jgi:acid stress-induced BolA-like protein IbaG/YrbA
MNGVSPEDIRAWISQAINCEQLEVAGDGAHFQAFVVSREFEGKNRVARHRLVFDTLGGRMENAIHALSIRALTPAEAKARFGADG